MEKQYSPSAKDNKVKDKEKIVKTAKPEKPIMEEKVEEKTEKKEKPVVKQEISVKDRAVVNGFSVKISPKNSKYIGKVIMKKTIDEAVSFLEQVILKKKAVPMNGAEIPHRKGKGMMSGRYPVNAAKEFIHLLGQLKANAQVNGIENPIITLSIANKAQLPYKKEGRRGKRTHVHIEVQEKTKIMVKKK